MENFNEKKRDMVRYMKFQPAASRPFPRLERFDLLLMVILTAITAVISFSFLGNPYSPQTLWQADNTGAVVLKLEKESYVETLQYFVGLKPDKKFFISLSQDAKNWVEGPEVATEGVFSWRSVTVSQWARYVKISPADRELSLFEVALRDINNEYIPAECADAPELTDEQAMAPATATYMNSTYFDEIYHARTAYEMIHGLNIYEWTHPPLGKAFIAAGIKIFGMTPFGWRFAGTLFGCLFVPAMYLFSYRVFGKRKWGIFSAVLMMFDFMRYTQTRIATIDTYVTFFIILMYYFMYKYYRMSFYDTPLKKTFPPLLFSGIFMGLGIACKWPGVYAGAGLAIIFFYTLYRRFMEYRYAAYNTDDTDKYDMFFKHAGKTCLFCILAFVIIPLVIYGLSYLTYFRSPDYNGLGDIIRNQKSIFTYHSQLVSEHPYGSPWWQWPIMARPVFYYSQTIGELKAGISAFGNPAIWWVGIPAFFVVFGLGFFKKDSDSKFLTIGYLAQYLPWVLILRTTYLYHYFPSVPFVILMITMMFKRYIDPRFKELTFLYPVVVLTLFVVFYAVLTGIPIPYWYADKFLRWLPGWQLVL